MGTYTGRVLLIHFELEYLVSMHSFPVTFKAEQSLCARHATKALLGAEQPRQLEQSTQRKI